MSSDGGTSVRTSFLFARLQTYKPTCLLTFIIIKHTEKMFSNNECGEAPTHFLPRYRYLF